MSIIFGTEEIKKRLHHRYPFLLIDRVIEFEKGISCTAIKNVTHNEPYFQGHFPQRPVMPGVLVVEAMAQAGGVVGYDLIDDPDNTLLMFVGIEKARFKSQVIPGDQLILKTKLIARKMILWSFEGSAYVMEDGKEKLVAKALLKVACVPIQQDK
ncbi:MAG: 3-hydroxyacyl-[acyl-carrier-protein] dehydratase [bacterium]|jgi:3-hydroxyacyl-[acyl-carrier-protein] dehydratase